MWFKNVALFVLVSACGSDSNESALARNEAAACDVENTAKLFWSATQVTYDYQPLPLDELISRSSTVVSGSIVSVRGAGSGDDLRTLFEVSVQRAYKGEIGPGQHLVVEEARAGSVAARVLEDSDSKLRGQDVTLFLQTLTSPRPAEVAKGVEVFNLTTPQALLVTGDCGVRVAFDSAPIEGADVDTAAELEAVIEAAL